MPELTVALESPPGDDAEALWEALKENNRRASGRPEPQKFSLFLRDGGKLMGGVNATTQWDVLYIDHVWIDDGLRGQGWGKRLMAMAEAEGVKRGAVKAILDTNDWQAPGFYEKLGYRELCRYGYNAGRYACFIMEKAPLA